MQRANFLLLLIILLITANTIPTYAGHILAPTRTTIIRAADTATSEIHESLKSIVPTNEKSGVLAYISAGLGVLGILIASPHVALALIIIGTLAGVSGKMGLKRYRGRTGLRVLCVVGIILGAIVLTLGMVPILFWAI